MFTRANLATDQPSPFILINAERGKRSITLLKEGPFLKLDLTIDTRIDRSALEIAAKAFGQAAKHSREHSHWMARRANRVDAAVQDGRSKMER